MSEKNKEEPQADMNTDEEESAPFEPANFCIPIHKILHDAQQSHGLTHDDYTQYRTYLTNRISRLRHSKPVYKRKSGKKNAYQAREITIDEANSHENFVLIALYIAERAWAHAMELKFASEGNGSGGGAGGKKSRYLKRLKKAIKHVKEVEDLILEICDETTKVEINCYAAWMRGNHFSEKSDWQNACKQYATALQTCHHLCSKSKREDKLQLSDFFLSRAENILEPLLRYCHYELQKEGSLTKEEIDKIVEVKLDEEDDEGGALQDKSDADNGSMNISFRGHDLSLDDSAIRMAFIKIQKKKEILENLKNSDNTKASTKDSKLMELLNGYDDTVEIIEKYVEKYEGMASGPAVNQKKKEYSNLLGYCKFEKLKLVMERNEAMVNILREGDKEFSSTKRNEHVSVNTQDDADAKYKLVEEIVRLYDALLQDARAATELFSSEDIENEVEDEFMLEANANVLRIRALRCYFLGRLYASDAIAKYSEAFALFDQASKLASEAAEEIAACQDMQDADALIEGMIEVEEEITTARCITKAYAYLANCGSGASTVTSGLSLLRRLDDFDSGGKTYRLTDVPPSLEAVAAKPFFFDIANNYVKDFPVSEIESYIHLTKPRKKTGLMSWFSRS